jgi:hypothetical protein
MPPKGKRNKVGEKDQLNTSIRLESEQVLMGSGRLEKVGHMQHQCPGGPK